MSKQKKQISQLENDLTKLQKEHSNLSDKLQLQSNNIDDKNQEIEKLTHAKSKIEEEMVK